MTASLPTELTGEPRLARLFKALTPQGHKVLIVGGAVRNALLGLPVDDVDLATDAVPEVVQALASAAGLKALPTGIEHGTITVIVEDRPFEVTTFRRDVQTDGRHAIVAFGTDLAQDAARRDFTMNALYAQPDGRILDPTGQGLADLAQRRLRFVGNPDTRITEDVLRILRFFRFHAHYGAPHAADAEALAACARHVTDLATLSRERVGAEMRKLLAAPDPVDAVSLMAGMGALSAVLPGADADHLPHLIAAEHAAGAPPDWQRRLALLTNCDPTDALRLSRAEAARHMRLSRAGRSLPFSVDETGYRLGAQEGRDAALIAAARGSVLPFGWATRLREAATAPLPISARDLSPPLSGPAIGRGLRAAETLWVQSGFAIPAPALIDAALTAGEESA